MSRKDKKRRHKRLHLITRLVIWGALFISIVCEYLIASGVISGLWLFLNELEQFEEKVLNMVAHYND